MAACIGKFAKVIRDGKMILVQEKTLVAGDIAIVEAGDIVPADMLVIEAENLRVDCSSLTGSEDVEFKSHKLSSMDPLETENLIFYGTRCVEGYGKGVVFSTGDRTAMASVIKLTTALQLTETSLLREVKHFVSMRMYVALSIGIIVISICLVLKFFWLKVLTLVLVLWLSNMPERLLNIVTLTE
ncbi:sodium/potassium-transporting ATPase subunit alpha-2-like [Uloborus diversus]|uniref:sodium/potassium-transporting ATPase subunit alpha-2-like n=1 Tax=Uloborus diversus TaxID=327109 RepID=UPI0024099535|nr:sodium/potassium-transporting ATPase subunit alpha-2-like [Uloborus diversus]